jgi:hypothetical protein
MKTSGNVPTVKLLREHPVNQQHFLMLYMLASTRFHTSNRDLGKILFVKTDYKKWIERC